MSERDSNEVTEQTREQQVAEARRRLQEQMNSQARQIGRGTTGYASILSAQQIRDAGQLTLHQLREAAQAELRTYHPVERVNVTLNLGNPNEPNRNNTTYDLFPESQGWAPELRREYEEYRDGQIERGLPVMIMQSWLRARLTEGHYQPTEAPVDQIQDELPEEQPMEEATHEVEAAPVDASNHIIGMDYGTVGQQPIMFERPNRATPFVPNQEELQARLNEELEWVRNQPQPEPATEDQQAVMRQDEIQATATHLEELRSEIHFIQEELDSEGNPQAIDEMTSRIENLLAREAELGERLAILEQEEMEALERRATAATTADRDGDGPAMERVEGFTARRAPIENVQGIRFNPEGITVNNMGTITAGTINTADFRTTWSDTPIRPYVPPKRYKFDEEKIDSTTTMLRAFQAIISRFDFTEQDIERLGIKDLVVEQVNTTATGRITIT